MFTQSGGTAKRAARADISPERVEYMALRQAEDKVFGMQKQKVRPARRRRNI